MLPSLLLLATFSTPADVALVLVYTPSPELSTRQAHLFEAHLSAELVKREGVQVTPNAAARSDAPAECEMQRSCLAKLAQAAGGDLVVLARTATLGSAQVVTLKRLRISTGEIEQSATKTIEGAGGQGFLVAIGPTVAALFPDAALRAGAQVGVSERYIERWDAPPLPAWAFWSALGLAGASGLTAGYFGLEKRDAEAEWEAAVNTDGAVVDGGALTAIERRASDAADRANIALGVTAGLAVGAGVLALFTDWAPELDREVLSLRF